MLAYRDATHGIDGHALWRELDRRLEGTCGSAPARQAHALSLFLRAAEVETALEDLSSPVRHVARAFTDACAAAWWQQGELDLARWRRELAALVLPERLVLKRPEGYAYYALDPAAYAGAALAVAPAGVDLTIIGVRSIGTSLSAAVCAALRASGRSARRATVRPTGPAWDRRCCFHGASQAASGGGDGAPEAASAAGDGVASGAVAGVAVPSSARAERGLMRDGTRYLIVDEGPGLSGSTFLAVAEGLEAAGVARERITLLTSHAPDPARLVAPDAARRWSRFRSRAIAESAPPASAGGVDVSAGRWRAQVFASERQWPFVWSTAERRKWLVSARSRLIKFVGLPPYGAGPFARGWALAESGFSPPIELLAGGYLAQRWVAGAVCSRAQELATPDFLARVIDYLTFRSRAFPARATGVEALDAMMRQNVREAIGVELPEQRLELRSCVYADARMQPHEWIASASGLQKVDAIDHGDDHGFPGPCDSAWDLAGAIVELDLEPARAETFLDGYGRRTGDDARARVGAYLVAYVAERIGRLHIAALSTSGAERARLDRELRRYGARLGPLVRRHFSDVVIPSGVDASG